MTFKQEKKQILSILQRGDRTIIAEQSGISGVTLWKALQRQSIAEMTAGEQKAWGATVDFVSKKTVVNEGYSKKARLLTKRIKSKAL